MLLTIADPEEDCKPQDVHSRHLLTCTLQELLHTSQQLQVRCNKWCHPGCTKMLENNKWYKGKGFPQDDPTLLNNCDVLNFQTLQGESEDS